MSSKPVIELVEERKNIALSLGFKNPNYMLHFVHDSGLCLDIGPTSGSIHIYGGPIDREEQRHAYNFYSGPVDDFEKQLKESLATFEGVKQNFKEMDKYHEEHPTV